MTKKILIEGMSCKHCSASVENALNALENVSAAVDLAAGTATVELSGDISDQMLREAVEAIGFGVVSIS